MRRFSSPFLGLWVRHRFCKYEVVLNVTLHLYFWALGPQPFLFFCNFGRVMLSSPEEGVFLFIFQCLPLFLPSSFHFPSLLSLFLSLSLYIFLFLSFSFASIFFLPSFLLSFCLVSLLLFHEKNIKILHLKGMISPLLFFSFVSCFVLSFKSLFLIFGFLILNYVFGQQRYFIFKEDHSKTLFFGEVGGCNKRFLVNNLYFANCGKLSFLGGPFLGQILVDVQKHC